MKSISSIIFLLGILSFPCYAQQDKVAHTLDYYFYINDQISLEKYWVNEFKINAMGKEVQNSKYQITERYFYHFLGNGEPLLRSVTIKSEDDAITYYGEYIFDMDGQFVLYVELQNDVEKYDYRRLRVFFENEEMLQWQVGKPDGGVEENEADNERVNSLLQKSQTLKEKFRLQMDNFQEF